MKIFNIVDDKLNKRESLHTGLMLDINKKSIISFVGGGGKTTLIFTLAEELKKLKKKVIITTTTRMVISEKYFLYSNSIEEINEKLHKDGIVVLGKPIGDNKFSALEKDITNELMEICDFILVEADGSKRLPLKAPEKHEPVIHEKSNIVVGVAGIDALGCSIKEICHRKERVCDLLKQDELHIITESDIADILSSDKGQMKNVNLKENNIRYIAAINKCDNDELVRKAKRITCILEERKIHSVITSFK